MQLLELTDGNGEAVYIDVQSSELLMGSEEEEGSEEPKEKVKYNEWINDGDQYFPAKDTKICKRLDPGHYSIKLSNNQFSCVKKKVSTDEIYVLPNDIVNVLVKGISTFWDNKDLFAQYGITHKRGVMLAGDPGNGKTSIIHQLTEEVIARGGIVFSVKSISELNFLLDFVHAFLREIEPDTPIMTVIEDIDSLVSTNESLLLNFLDGEDQFEHNVVVATTNRLHELNDLLMRPSRFDETFIIESPSSEVREVFLIKKGVSSDEIAEWVDKSKGLSMAELKELFVAVKLLGKTLSDAVDQMKAKAKHVSNKTFQRKPETTGFSFNKK